LQPVQYDPLGTLRRETAIASAERYGLDPQQYLTSVPAKIAGSTLSEPGQFLPDVWKVEDAFKPQKA